MSLIGTGPFFWLDGYFRTGGNLQPINVSADVSAQVGQLIVMDSSGGVRNVAAPAGVPGDRFSVTRKGANNVLINGTNLGDWLTPGSYISTVSMTRDGQTLNYEKDNGGLWILVA